MHGIGTWVAGAMFAVTGLMALYIASGATDAIMYYTGIAFFVASILFNFYLIKRHYDEAEHGHGASGHTNLPTTHG